MDGWCTWIPLLQIRERRITHLWSFSCYFDIVCLTTLIDVFQNEGKGIQNRAINQNGHKRHQVQLKRMVTVPKRSPLLLLTPLRSLSKQFITSLAHSVSFSRDGRVRCVVAASLCVGERTVQDAECEATQKPLSVARKRNGMRWRGGERPLLCLGSSVRLPARFALQPVTQALPTREEVFFFFNSLILSPFLYRPRHYRRRRHCSLDLISGRPVAT
jgi:hypothetical protein